MIATKSIVTRIRRLRARGRATMYCIALLISALAIAMIVFSKA
jgi:hypothetical protein